MIEALLYQKKEKKAVKCNICNHHCNIKENEKGLCQTRQNINGQLFSLVYGKVISHGVDPIEKKPLFHFLPGSRIYSYATIGCNFHCANCHNWQISQFLKLNKNVIAGEEIKPQDIVKQAIVHCCPSIAATYTEPTIFLEYALAVMKEAKKKKLRNVWVSNGFMSKETLDLIIPYLDAINIDLKFYSDKLYQKNCGARLQPILENLKYLKKKKIWLEITTLAIPGLSDDDQMFNKIAEFIATELGETTPWHISSFSPEISYKLQNNSKTSINTINNAINIGKQQGLKYVYGGNVVSKNLENTYCPHCQNLLVERDNYRTNILFKKNKCPKCNNKIDFIL